MVYFSWGCEENYSNQATEYLGNKEVRDTRPWMECHHRDSRMLNLDACFFHKETVSLVDCCLDRRAFLWGGCGEDPMRFFPLLRHVAALNLNLHLSSPQAIPTTFEAFTFHKTSLEDNRFLKGFPECLGIQPPALRGYCLRGCLSSQAWGRGRRGI